MRLRRKKKASKKAKPAPAGATHRLENMVTEEVSIVNAGANNRKFIVIKGQAMPPSLLPPSLRECLRQAQLKKRTSGLTPPLAVLEAVLSAIDGLWLVSQALKNAEINDAADVPEELLADLVKAIAFLNDAEGLARKAVAA